MKRYLCNHWFVFILAYDLELSKEKINEITSSFAKHGNMLILDLRRVFLIEDIFESMKFGLSLWLFTYVGSFINANTIVILAWTGLFTIPKVSSCPYRKLRIGLKKNMTSLKVYYMRKMPVYWSVSNIVTQGYISHCWGLGIKQ